MGLLQELYLIVVSARFVQPLERFDDMGLITLGLIEKGPREAHTDLEAGMGLNNIGKQERRGQIALLRDLLEDLLVLLHPQQGCPLRVESQGLMQLKVECHQCQSSESLP